VAINHCRCHFVALAHHQLPARPAMSWSKPRVSR
jgi:hypothetical protein